MTPDSNFADRWPELFGTLDDQQRAEVLRELAASGREGGPTREEVENLTDRARGAIDDHEYGRRARPSADGQNGGSGDSDQFDVEGRWPELFARLDERQREATVEALAANWHEGWVQNREDVENLTDHARGAIDDDEYDRRSLEAVDRRHPPATAT